MLNSNKTCKLHPINAKNHAKTSLPGNYDINKWGGCVLCGGCNGDDP